jgi:hypothetical protein
MRGWVVPEHRDDDWTHDPCSSDDHCDQRNPPDATPTFEGRKGISAVGEAAVRKLVELANGFEPIPDGRIYIEKLNGPMLFELKATPAECKAGLDYAMAKDWLLLHESGTFVRFTQAGADLFA